MNIPCPNEIHHGVMYNVKKPELIPYKPDEGHYILKMVKQCGMCSLRLQFSFSVNASYDNKQDTI